MLQRNRRATGADFRLPAAHPMDTLAHRLASGTLDGTEYDAGPIRHQMPKCQTMLELRPCCEHCAKDLPPDSTEARICSYECTFCADCVDEVLDNVCPNCGGGFAPRPVRPARNWKGNNHLGKDPAGTVRKHRPVDPAVQAGFAAAIRDIPPERR